MSAHGTLSRYQAGCKCCRCRDANAAHHREYRRTPAGKKCVRTMNLKKYGLTIPQYTALLEKQGGVCAVCREDGRTRNQFGFGAMPVDHDHTTGAVRGLLCNLCNRAAGFLRHDPARIRRLAEYLEGSP